MAKRGRKSAQDQEVEIVEALLHLHDLDWLDECAVTDYPPVKKFVNPSDAMARGQALRKLLLRSIKRVEDALADVPGYESFFDAFCRGEAVSKIARDLGVRREVVFRNYRPRALSLVAKDFVQMLKTSEQSGQLASYTDRARHTQ